VEGGARDRNRHSQSKKVAKTLISNLDNLLRKNPTPPRRNYLSCLLHQKIPKPKRTHLPRWDSQISSPTQVLLVRFSFSLLEAVGPFDRNLKDAGIDVTQFLTTGWRLVHTSLGTYYFVSKDIFFRTKGQGICCACLPPASTLNPFS